MVELTMPKLSDSMEDAVIVRWLKGEGDRFARGEPLAEIETDKATVVYEAETDGVIAAIVVPEGSAAGVGEPIATLAGNGAAAAPPPAPAREAPAASPPPAPAARNGSSAPARPRATPVARRRAVELGVSLHGLEGTGPGGRITARDVERSAPDAPAAPAAPPAEQSDRGTVDTVPLTPTRATIARRMAASTAIPTFTVSIEIDMGGVVALRRGAGDVVEPLPSINDFVVRATALALRKFPAFNSSWAGDHVERFSRINVGIAVGTEDALLVPVVVDADRKTLADIATATRSLADRARSRSLGPDDLAGATFTVSNLGMFGVHSFSATVDAPQVSILAVGGIARRPSEGADGGVVFRDTMIATLTSDHRVIYGADAAAFLAHVRTLLETPLSLLL
jgi:pyruvate dehydrogenase E2 component (dihydrolipoamide acetyltransferase)